MKTEAMIGCKPINVIDDDIGFERAALRRLSEIEDAADAANDEYAYRTARDASMYHCHRIDTLTLERKRARYAMFSINVNSGAFASRFQVVQDGNNYSILDTREGIEIESGIVMGAFAEARAREMGHFAHQREQAERYKINLSTRR
jgi:hypothetical protein